MSKPRIHFATPAKILIGDEPPHEVDLCGRAWLKSTWGCKNLTKDWSRVTCQTCLRKRPESDCLPTTTGEQG